jgi:hypothetical protein
METPFPKYPLEDRPSLSEMQDLIKRMGLKKAFKPYAEGEQGRFILLLESRKPFKIVEGYLHGTQIDVYDWETVRVWTNQKQKANTIAKLVSCRVRNLDGEAEIYLPAARADEFLHHLGAKVKHRMSPERLAVVRARLLAIPIETRLASLEKARAARKTNKTMNSGSSVATLDRP